MILKCPFGAAAVALLLMKVSPRGRRTASSLCVDAGDLAGAELRAILEPPSVQFLSGVRLLCSSVEVKSCRFVDTRTRTGAHIVKRDANNALIPAQGRLFITCNAGKSGWCDGPPAGITDWRREAAAKGVASHQLTGADRRCDARILMGRVEHLHLSRGICRGNQERSARRRSASSRLKTSVYLLLGDSLSRA